MGTVEVSRVGSRPDLDAFVALPYALHRTDPCFTPRLRRDVRSLLDPARNPFFRHAERELFLARRDGRVAGRIAAIHDRLHGETHRDGAGFFGFFDAVHDEAVARALLDAASAFLAARGLLAYERQATELPARLVAATDRVARRHGLRCRALEMRRFADDVAIVQRLFNAGWRDNWGAVA